MFIFLNPFRILFDSNWFEVPTEFKKFLMALKIKQSFILFIYFSHYKIWKILGCDNGLFLLNLDSGNTHINNIEAKRLKLSDNSTYMWHCRLGHIGVKRMKKLHSDGLLESLDSESLERCEACLMGKMTKTPFSGMMERAMDLGESRVSSQSSMMRTPQHQPPSQLGGHPPRVRSSRSLTRTNRNGELNTYARM